MIKLNRKGFTLVELLAVIVVLAIIMIIAIPSVMDQMQNARKGTFKVYAQKVLNQAQTTYQSDVLSGAITGQLYTTVTGVTGANRAYCYTLATLKLTSGGNYDGHVIIAVDANNSPVENFITISDKTGFSVSKFTYTQLTNSATEYASPVAFSTISTCPTGTTWAR